MLVKAAQLGKMNENNRCSSNLVLHMSKSSKQVRKVVTLYCTSPKARRVKST